MGRSLGCLGRIRGSRYQIKTLRITDELPSSHAVLQSVEQYDGEKTIVYDAITNEYVVSHDDDPPKWVAPFLRLWGHLPLDRPFDRYSLILITDEHQAESGLIGFVLLLMSSEGGLGLRTRDYTPLFSGEELHQQNGIEVHRYFVCKPMLYERHSDREVDWSLPPGAKLVDQLKDAN